MAHANQHQQLRLPVHGMLCASNVSQVENALRKLPAVSNVIVDLETNQLLLSYDATKMDLFDIHKALTEAGFPVPAEQVTLQVSGMHCISCLSHIEGALLDLPGVIEATVSLSQGTAQVRYIPDMVTTAQMEAAAQDAGYEAHAQEVAKKPLNPEQETPKIDQLQSEGSEKAAGSSSLFAWMKKTLPKSFRIGDRS